MINSITQAPVLKYFDVSADVTVSVDASSEGLGACLLQGMQPVAYASSTISKTRAIVSSGYPNTEKQMKAQGRRPSAFIVSRCLDTSMKHEARVLEITSHDHSQTNHKQRLPIRIVCYLTFLPG